MKFKSLLLFFLIFWGIVNAQDSTLVISEVRIDRADHSYIELTNMGSNPINLSEYEFGTIGAWTQPYEAPDGYYLMLPDHVLQPGESYVIAVAYDFTSEQWAKDVKKFGYSQNYSDYLTKREMWNLADLLLHASEPNGDATDSVSDNWRVMEVWNGRDCWYLEHHFPVADTAGAPMDSLVIDQFGGVWDDTDGSNKDQAYDVAGFTRATGRAILMRKFTVKDGNTDFANARGQDVNESEWIPVPMLRPGNDTYEPWRAVFWTVGNHGDYNLTEATFTSSTVDINWADSSLLVPWGVRRDDSLIMQFDRVPGIAWHYDYYYDTLNEVKSHEDSSYVSVRTGDILTVYACGNDMDMVKFKIQVAEPTNDANIVVPKKVKTRTGWYTDLMRIPYFVTDKVPGMDTIIIRSPKSFHYTGMPLATRTDTLFKYLEKAQNASWEIVFSGGEERTDVIDGDILKVTANNGSVKEYYIKVYPYRKARNAYLAAITWPDIPEFYRGIFGWVGDTIPNFANGKYEYKVQVPWDANGIPALVGITQDVNAKVSVDRAVNLAGSLADRTTTFTTTAENDTTHLTYKVELVKEQDPQNIQLWDFEPFISEFVFQDNWGNYFLEICNPGPVPLDLSNYMIVKSWYTVTPAQAIEGTDEATGAAWRNRFIKYIPGYKWAPDSTTWKADPAKAIQDVNLNPNVYPGDVFVMAEINTVDRPYSSRPWFDGGWPPEEQSDVIFKHPTKGNAWNEFVGESPILGWNGWSTHIFKILNDSIKLGLKAANDANDFELIETLGQGDNQRWRVVAPTGIDQTATIIRKPQYYMPKPGYAESFSEDPDSSEWIYYNRAYWNSKNVWWPWDILYDVLDVGAHFMNEITFYKSTISSIVYKVSPGYSLNEEIKGVKTGTSVTDFLANIIKSDPEQTLIVKDGTTGAELTGAEILTNADTLVVFSADSVNTTKYLLNLAYVLSSNAVLTSAVYTITTGDTTGTISGLTYGTALKDVPDNVTVPPLATMTIVDANDAWVPFTKADFDTNYVDVMVSDQIFFEVVAEDGVTKILYQLKPTALASDAFVTSDVFMVSQTTFLIDYIPQGTSVQAFLANLYPVTGATMKLVNKLNQERTFGTISKDDRLIVTSQDLQNVTVYYLKMLAAYEGEVTDYLAYVTSNVFAVDQYNLTISHSTITQNTTVSYLLARLTPSTGATIKVVNAADVENTGTLNEGDLVKVTAANGITTAYYAIDVNIVSVDEMGSVAINIYPNPTSGKITVSGLEPGNRIRIYNILGANLRDIVTTRSEEFISLEGQSEGVYFVVVSNDDTVIGRYKLVIK